MKYKFAVQRYDDNETEDRLMGSPLYDRPEEVFSIEINADEMVELMQHLWDIGDRRRKQIKS